MANNSPESTFPSQRLPVSGQPLEPLRGYPAALALGVTGAVAAALFICAHWSFALLGAVAVLALSSVEYEPFLLFIVFLTPFSASVLTEGSRHDVSSAIHSLVLIGFFFGRVWRGRLDLRGLLRSSPARASLWFLGAVIVSIVLGKAGWTRESAHSLYTIGVYIGFFFLVLVWTDSPARVQKILRVLLYSTITTAVFALVQEVAGGYTSLWLYLNPPGNDLLTWEGRATSFLSYPNSLAGYLDLVLPLALACYLLGQGSWKKLGGWTVGLGAFALLTTQSIGGILGFVAIIVLAIFYFTKTLKKRLVLLASVFFSLAVLYFMRAALNPAHIQVDMANDAAIRLLLWATAWKLFTAAPFLGVGWGNFVGLYGSEIASSSLIPPGVFEVHNIYLQLLAETGVVGFVAFFNLVAQSWRQARDQRHSSLYSLDRALAFGVLGALVSVVVHGFVDFLFQVSPQFGTLFWILLALLVASTSLKCMPLAGVSHMRKVG